MNILSIIIPVYNEERTIKKLLGSIIELNLANGFNKEIIIVNDCSTDNSDLIISNIIKNKNNIKYLKNDKNLGKSQSVIKGIKLHKGTHMIIQDADLELDVNDINNMLEHLVKNDLDVVFGNRFGKKNKILYKKNYYGNIFLSFVTNIFTYPRIKTYLPDVNVCYKLVKSSVINKIKNNLISKTSFGIEPELTAKLSKVKLKGKKVKWSVLPINYYPRTKEEGKHINAFSDGLKTLKEIFIFNIFS